MKLIIICLVMCFVVTIHSQDIEDNKLEPIKVENDKDIIKGFPLGAYEVTDENDPEMIEVANKAIEMLKEKTPDIELVKIVSVATQVVAGVNYRLVLKVKTNNQIEKWAVVLYRRFDNTYTLTSCQKIEAPKLPKRPGPLAGGYRVQDVTKPEIIEVANKAVEMLKKQTPDIELVKIVSAATQVVAGLNYRFVLEVKTNNEIEKWTVVVYRSLKNTYMITSCKK